MTAIHGAVYDPPSAELPCVAVVFTSSGEVLSACAVHTVEAGEALIAAILAEANAAIPAG